MSDDGDNPFSDMGSDHEPLGDELDLSEDTSSTSESEGKTAQSPALDSSQPDTATQGPTSSQTTGQSGPELSDSSPPFTYKQATQDQLYLQDGLSDRFDDHKMDAKVELRRQFDVRNVEVREIDTALVELALDMVSPEDIAAKVVEKRGFDPDSI